jgi:hypothetical protein
MRLGGVKAFGFMVDKDAVHFETHLGFFNLEVFEFEIERPRVLNKFVGGKELFMPPVAFHLGLQVF